MTITIQSMVQRRKQNIQLNWPRTVDIQFQTFNQVAKLIHSGQNGILRQLREKHQFRIYLSDISNIKLSLLTGLTVAVADQTET